MLRGKNHKNTDALVDTGSVRVLVIGCVLIVAVILLMSISSIRIMSQAVVTKLKTRDMVNLAQSYGAVIEGKIDRAIDASLLLSDDPEALNWIKSGERDARAGQDVKVKMAELVENFGYQASFLASDQTRHYWSFSDQKLRMLHTLSSQTSSDAWFFKTLRIHKRYEINIDYNAQLKNTYVWINVLVGDVSHPNAIAGLGMNLSDVIRDVIVQNKADNDLWLVNGTGLVELATNKKEMDKTVRSLLPASIAERINGKAQGRLFAIDDYTDAKGRQYDVAYRQIRDTDWKLVIRIPRTETTGFLSPVTQNIAISGIGILLIVLLLFYISARQLANPYKRAIMLNHELEQIVARRTSELEEKNQKIQDGIDYARSIQQTILPSDNELAGSFKQYFVLYEPKDTVGGDFYWARRVKSGLLLIVGDCTGHGVAGALMTTAVNAMLNQITEQNAKDPAQILTELDQRIKGFARTDDNELVAPYGLDAAVIFLPDEGGLVFSGAALPAYVWDGETVSELPACGGTIDSMIRRKPKPYTNRVVTPRSDSTIYLSTDGFREQPGGPKGLPFGKTRCMGMLRQIAPLPMEQQKEALRTALRGYQGKEPRRDDISVFGFKM